MNVFTKIVCLTCTSLLTTSLFAQDWTMKQAKLMTPFAATIDTANVLGEYPRPQMVRRDWKNLNGIWQFQPGTGATEAVPTGNLTRKILVPFPVESAISGIMTHYERLWYRRKFTVPTNWSGQRILLHFGAVDFESEVYVNGVSVGVHKGGYDPFTYDVTDYISGTGSQDLTVRVYDPTNAGGQPRGKQTLNPGGIMYTCSSGIWQSVWMEPVPQTSISEIKLVPDIDKSVLNLAVLTSGVATNQTVSVVVKDGENVVTTYDGSANSNLIIPIPSAKLWSPASPFLYDLTITLKSEGSKIDSLTSYFGLRKLSMKSIGGFQKLLLNNEFLFQMGPLDQGFWPDGLYTAPTDSALKFDIVKMKDFGFNMVRKHIKVEPARWYYWADKLGIMVWQDMPSPNTYTDVHPAVDTEEFRSELISLVKNHWNSPSIVMWVVFNENQGQHDVASLVSDVYALDSTRFINQGSGGPYVGAGSVKDEHHYTRPAYPVNAKLATVCGEYGGIGLTVANHVWGTAGTYVMVNNTTELFTMYNEFIDNLVEYKSYNGLSAAVYTEITDVEKELNGLLTYDRVLTKGLASNFFNANQKAIYKINLLNQKEILPTAATSVQSWRYFASTVSAPTPTAGWQNVVYDDAAWKTGNSGFGTSGGVVRTTWNSSDIWLRKEFMLENYAPAMMDSMLLNLFHDEDCEVYINGVQALAETGYRSNYYMFEMASDAKKALIPNAKNTIAIHCKQTAGGQFIDAGLVLRTYTLNPLPTGINTIGMDGCAIYPNPTDKEIRLSGFDSNNVTANIYNATGMSVLQKRGFLNSMDVSGLQEGAYMLVINNDKTSKTFKFIKKK